MYFQNISSTPLHTIYSKPLTTPNPTVKYGLTRMKRRNRVLSTMRCTINYQKYKQAGKITKSTPSMCVLFVKNDKDGKPLCTKSRIAVLGNFEDRIYQKPQRYTPVQVSYCHPRKLRRKPISKITTLCSGPQI